MKRTQLNLDEKTYIKLVDYSRKKKVSLSGAARELLNKQMQTEQNIDKNPLLGLAELGRKLKVKAPRDLSINHNYYLYGKGSPK